VSHGVFSGQLFLSDRARASSFLPALVDCSRDTRTTGSQANQEFPMKTKLTLMLAFTAAMTAHAKSIEKAIVAAMSLSEESNYSWHCSVLDDARSYEIEGKISDGYTWQRQPMPKTIAKRLGRGAGDLLEAVFRDTYTYVIATEGGWKNLSELPKRHDDWQDDEWIYVSAPVWRSPDMPADESGFDPFGLPRAIYLPVIRHDEDASEVPYSNAQFALAQPHQELAIVVSCHTDLCVNGDVASGTLNDIGAQLLLVHDGHEYIKPVLATGRFKLWLRGDSVTKYVLELAGILVVERKPVYVRQKSTTVLTDVGTTVFTLPSDARQRLTPLTRTADSSKAR
jgi:hypothetical protein